MSWISVLVVEDDPDFAEGLADIIQLAGHEVSVAPSGEQAIELLSERSFHVALLDMQLPGINGIECLRTLKQLSRQTRAFLMTGYSAPDLVDDARLAGAGSVLQKPLNNAMMLELIRNAATC